MAERKVCLSFDANGSPIQGALCPSTVISLAYTSVSNRTGAIDGEVIRLISTSDCYVKFGDVDIVTATTSDMLMVAGKPEYFSLRGKKSIAAIRVSADGTLNITVMV